MPTSQTRKTPPSTTDQKLPSREIAYYTRRTQNLIFDAIIRAFTEEVEAGRISRATLAKRINSTAPQVTRWLSGPSNLTANTIGMLLLGMKAELDPRVVFHRDIQKPNTAHPFFDHLATAQSRAVEVVNFATETLNNDQIQITGGTRPNTLSESQKVEVL